MRAEPDLDLQDPHAPDLALRAPATLAQLNRERTLIASDIHVAAVLGQLTGVHDEQIQRCAALAVAAARQGHTFVELSPADAALLETASGLVGTDAQQDAPLRLVGRRLYLDRYWREERRLAAALLTRNRMRADVGELATLRRLLVAAHPEPGSDEQRTAVAVALLRQLAVIAGGPGTGKTTTVARVVALLRELAGVQGHAQPLIALCAPTGKAAARLREAVGGGLQASTIHRLLGAAAGGRFRHDAANPLPHDAVIVDETSMVPLWLMVRLVDALREDARLILVGDPDQLAAIEVGAVLADIIGPAAGGPRRSAGMCATLERVVDGGCASVPQPPGDRGPTLGDAIALLRHGHRSLAPIGRLAEAIRRGDGEAAVTLLRDEQHAQVISWVPDPIADPGVLRTAALDAYLPMMAAARAGEATTALAELSRFRLLCVHRHGPYGALSWAARIEGWLRTELPELDMSGPRYAGLALVVTRNSYELGLHNGDAGIVIRAAEGDLRAVFDAGGGQVAVAPSRLADIEPLFAQTVHRSQGSEFDTAAVLLPQADSPLLCRELLYTAVTRARQRLLLAGSEAAVRAALARPAGRASGLEELLWGPTPA